MADAHVTIVVSPSKLSTYLRDPNGAVTRDLVKRGTRVQTEARRLVGKKTHNLEQRIVKRVVMVNGVPAVQVGFVGVPYGLFHHEGTRPHPITARDGHYLRFEGRKGVTYRRSVNHPGTKPNRFLVNALRVA